MKIKFTQRFCGKILLAFAGLAIGLSPMPSLAQVFVSGSTGADGPFNPTCTPAPCTVTVQLPPSGIFNYTTVNIPASVTVKFARNQANTPVTILTTGDVTIGGLIDVSGGIANGFTPGKGGPGGFDGGIGGTPAHIKGTAGLGPGGGPGGDPALGAGVSCAGCGGGAGFATAGNGPGGAGTGGVPYGVPTVFPLIGGSGGGGGMGGNISDGPGGGGGGGAILIASSGTINFSSQLASVRAVAGNGSVLVVDTVTGQSVHSGCGSGGAIRLIANTMSGGQIETRDLNCSITTLGTATGGSSGRVRLEAFNLGNITSFPAASRGTPGQVPALPGPNFPKVQITSIGGAAVPPNPQATFLSVPDTSLDPNSTPNPVTVDLQASNVSLGTVIAVSVVTEGFTTATTVNSTPLAGTLASSTATASVTLPPGVSVITAAATFAAAP
jgi:hypothetical protein